MNILLVSHDFTVTGAPNSLLRQAKYFRDAGHNVDVWGLGDGALKARYIESGFNPLVIKNRFRDIKRAWRARAHDYDFIICNTTVTYRAVDFLQRQNIPIVWFIRETKLVDEGIANNNKFREVFRNFYNIYTVSGYAADVCRRYNSSVRVINNSVEDKFQKFKKTDERIVFGYIGSIIPVKGVDILLRAFTKIATENKNVELRIAGEYKNAFGTELQKYNIPQVKWLGEIQGVDKEKFFNSIDVLIVPSLDEPSGLTVIEGAMYGVPVITTDKTGAKYMVQNGESGFITKTGDVEDLYKSMSKIIQMNLDNMKQKSREMYLKYGTTDKEREQVLDMLARNKENLPVVKNRSISRLHIFERRGDARVHIYLFGIKIASFCGFYKKHLMRFTKTHKIDLKDKNIISLGMNCFTRTMLTYWGLKKKKEDGELSYPFDLAVHFTEPLIEVLNNDFDGFLDNFVFKPLSGYWINNRYGFIYIHDADCGESEKEKLVARLMGRVKNWKNMISDMKPAYFFLYLDTVEMNLDREHANLVAGNMAKTIFTLRDGRPTKLVIISTEKIKIDMKNVFVLCAPLPWKGFKWSTRDRISVRGTRYEQKVAQFCYDVLAKKED